MAEIGSPGTRTRGIENIIDAPSFSLGFTQQENPIAGGSSYAEMRSKKINDPRRNKQHHDSHDDKEIKRKQSAPDKKVSQVPLQKKRKVAKNVPGGKGKKVVRKKPSIDVEDVGEDSRFLVTKQPAVAPSMQGYTNVNVISDIRAKLKGAGQMDKFADSIFGKYLRMQHMDVQAQLFRCFMVKELKGSTYECFTFEINGKVLCFSIREFALITGLNCVSDANEFVYDKGENNRLMDDYLGGTSDHIKRGQLIECFNNTDWKDKGEDAVKMAILYFINTFVFCGEPVRSNIPRIHFDVVEDGRYVDYPWGKESFKELVTSISQKYADFKQYYRIHGMPIAMQVWLYESCSKVPSNIAIKSGNLIPRILNWRTIDQRPKFDALMEGMFRDDIHSICTFHDVVPTTVELERLNLPPVVSQAIPNLTHGVEIAEGNEMVDDEYDDFSTTPPHNVRGKQQQRSAVSDSLPHKKRRPVSVTDSTVRKQPARNEPLTASKDASTSTHRVVQTATKSDEVKLLRQEFQAFKNDVSAQLTEINKSMNDIRKSMDDIRKCIDDKFKKVVEAIKGNQTSEKAADSEAPVNQYEVSIQYSHEFNQEQQYAKETSTVKVGMDENKLAGTMLTGDVSGVGMLRSTHSGDTLRASTEEIQGSGETPPKPTQPQGEAVIVHTHVSDPAVQQGGVNDDAEFSASEQMVAELLIQCPLATVIPLGPPAIQVNDQADAYMFKTPQSSKVENVVPNSQWLIPDDELPSQLGVQPTTGQGLAAEIPQPSIENTERRIIVHPSVVRDRKPSKYTVSPFMPNYSSASSSARSSVPIKFEKKHPFVEHPINAPADMAYFQEYEIWLKKGLLSRHDKKRDKENHYRKNKELVDHDDACRYVTQVRRHTC
ncbi:uncharacterized protein LOC132601306 [Lycium barbarum]|uniref:uncharacterized protein LOC132601306 n=1 Tax=Lycium barbarum TaxID=112863 RepID=UPI00293E4D84|nr:uncharacterized protein LOC132601306 [Lycium barbarum]